LCVDSMFEVTNCRIVHPDETATTNTVSAISQLFPLKDPEHWSVEVLSLEIANDPDRPRGKRRTVTHHDATSVQYTPPGHNRMATGSPAGPTKPCKRICIGKYCE